MAELRDLVTVGFKPRETMRRVLDGRDRWTVQVVALAFLATSVVDSDSKTLGTVLPGLGASAIALVALGLIAGACAWVILLFVFGWIAAFAGRRLGGTAPAADVRAALAWGLVPLLWSPLYRIPFALVAARFHLQPNEGRSEILLDFVSHGGCSIMVVYIVMQLLFMVWSIWVGSCCVGEAQRFSSAKGFANVAIALVAPIVIVIAAVLAHR